MHIASGTLIMAVDGAKMLLFRNDGDAIRPALTTVEHREIADPPSREQGTDTPGRTFASVGRRRSAYSETDWQRQTESRFAADAAGTLAAKAAEEKSGIVVIAPPRTLGELRKHYDAAVKTRLLAEIGKDLAGHSTDDIVGAVAAYEA